MSMPLICIVRLTALGKLYTRNGHVRTAAPASTPPMNNLRLILNRSALRMFLVPGNPISSILSPCNKWWLWPGLIPAPTFGHLAHLAQDLRPRLRRLTELWSYADSVSTQLTVRASPRVHPRRRATLSGPFGPKLVGQLVAS